MPYLLALSHNGVLLLLNEPCISTSRAQSLSAFTLVTCAVALMAQSMRASSMYNDFFTFISQVYQKTLQRYNLFSKKQSFLGSKNRLKANKIGLHLNKVKHNPNEKVLKTPMKSVVLVLLYECYSQTSHYDADHRHEFDEDVE